MKNAVPWNLGRGVLLGGILLVFILLLQEWMVFRGEYRTQISSVTPAPVTPSGSDAPGTPREDFPERPAEAGEIPEAWTAAGEENSDAPAAPRQRPRENLVQVFTDTLHLEIDLRGGDIVHLSLPRHPVSLKTPQTPYPLLEEEAYREYIAQSGLIGEDGVDRPDSRPLYRARARSYRMEDGADSLRIELDFLSPGGVRIQKFFLLHRGAYHFEIGYRIDNQGRDAWRANMFSQFKRDESADPYTEEAFFAPRSFLGAALHTPEKRYKKLDFDDLRKSDYQRDLRGGWIALVQHYFVAAWIPAAETVNRYRASFAPGAGRAYAGLTSAPLRAAPGESIEARIRLYAGPKDQDVLRQLAPGLELTVDYGFLFFISQPLFEVLQWLHALLGNWGWAIIFLTLLVKLLFYPLSNIGYRSMARMRSLQPKVNELRERYSSDRQKMSVELMQLYRKEKINPMGGCLPILLQMPVFLALYWVLLESVELRHAPFVGWIRDLSQMDPWFVLPLLMGVSMFVQQKLNPPPPDPMQARIMQWLPVIFTFFFLFFPAGLVLYWLVNSLLSILQQWWINRQVERSAAAAAT